MIRKKELYAEQTDLVANSQNLKKVQNQNISKEEYEKQYKEIDFKKRETLIQNFEENVKSELDKSKISLNLSDSSNFEKSQLL